MGYMGYLGHMGCAPCWAPAWAWILLNELEADSTSTSAAAFTGEGGASSAWVEYWVDKSAASPAVTVTIDSGGTTTTWTATALTPGFHVRRFGSVPRGSMLTLTVTGVMARLRWCEPVCC
jgi:hypothetical protein